MLVDEKPLRSVAISLERRSATDQVLSAHLVAAVESDTHSFTGLHPGTWRVAVKDVVGFVSEPPQDVVVRAGEKTVVVFRLRRKP